MFPKTVLDQVDRLMSGFARRLDVIEPLPFLHDTKTKNVIVSPEGYLSGIVDVDDLCVGDTRYPAALTAAALLNSGGPTDYVHAWLAHARQPWDGLFEFYVATFLLRLPAEGMVKWPSCLERQLSGFGIQPVNGRRGRFRLALRRQGR